MSKERHAHPLKTACAASIGVGCGSSVRPPEHAWQGELWPSMKNKIYVQSSVKSAISTKELPRNQSLGRVPTMPAKVVTPSQPKSTVVARVCCLHANARAPVRHPCQAVTASGCGSQTTRRAPLAGLVAASLRVCPLVLLLQVTKPVAN